MTKQDKYVPNKELLKAHIPDFSNRINLDEFIESTYDKLQAGLSGVYVPLDEKFEKGISSENEEEKASWGNANPFKAPFAKLNEETKQLIRRAFYQNLMQLVPVPNPPEIPVKKDEQEKKKDSK